MHSVERFTIHIFIVLNGTWPLTRTTTTSATHNMINQTFYCFAKNNQTFHYQEVVCYRLAEVLKSAEALKFVLCGSTCVQYLSDVTLT